jgi:hypothetical protein
LTNATVLYAPLTDLRLVMGGTDAGSGDPSTLSDAQLTLALTSASNVVSAYAGNVFDVTQAMTGQNFTPPVLLHDVCLDLATWYAWRFYNKHKEIGAQHPAMLAYTHAIKVLEDVRDGRVRVDPDIPGSPGAETGHVNNPIPPIFTGDNSNTYYDPFTGTIEPSVPDDMFRADLGELYGSEYQG